MATPRSIPGCHVATGSAVAACLFENSSWVRGRHASLAKPRDTWQRLMFRRTPKACSVVAVYRESHEVKRRHGFRTGCSFVYPSSAQRACPYWWHSKDNGTGCPIGGRVLIPTATPSSPRSAIKLPVGSLPPLAMRETLRRRDRPAASVLTPPVVHLPTGASALSPSVFFVCPAPARTT